MPVFSTCFRPKVSTPNFRGFHVLYVALLALMLSRQRVGKTKTKNTSLVSFCNNDRETIRRRRQGEGGGGWSDLYERSLSVKYRENVDRRFSL